MESHYYSTCAARMMRQILHPMIALKMIMIPWLRWKVIALQELIDKMQVHHTFLVTFVFGNYTAKSKMQRQSCPNDRCDAFKRLVKQQHEDVGIHAINIREADEVTMNLFYAGEKPPRKCSLELKRHTRARDAYVQREGCIVYSNS